MSKFVIETVATGVKFELRAGNGETVAVSEVYSSPAACLRGIESVKKCAASGKIADLTRPSGAPMTNPKFEVYQDRRGDHRFRLRARNGQIIATSEPYSGKAACLSGVESVINAASNARIEKAED